MATTPTSDPFRAYGSTPPSNPFDDGAPAGGVVIGPAPAGRPAKRRRRWKGSVAAGIAGLVLGSLLSGSAEPTESTEYRTLESELSATQSDLESATTRAEEAEAQVEALSQQVASGEQAVAAAEAATEAAAAKEAELAAQAAQLAAREGAVVAAEASATAAAERAAAAPAPIVGVLPSSPGTSSSVSYGNCSEARAAGAAPVRRGEPGYGSHLDRDGDGVGCER